MTRGKRATNNVELIGLASLFLLSAVACDHAPQTFDDCILKNMQSVTSNVAAQEIRRSCREKFPEKKVTESDRELNALELAELNGRAGLEFRGRFGGTIYNGVTVTQLRIKVTTKIDRQDVARIYTDDVIIPPHSAKAFGFDIVVGDNGADYSWDTDGARGH